LQINRIKIENLRNITEAAISPHNRLNIIIGNNGAGKTTILEAIYLLARARSFRQKRDGRLIKEGTERLTLFAQLQTTENYTHKIGLQKTRRQTEIKKDGKNLKRLSELAKTIPLTIITPNIQRIIEEEPQHRRRLLNWGLFHVEHGYGELVNRYNKTLAQRNSALRGSTQQLKVWDKQLNSLGVEINRLMEVYCSVWSQAISEMLKQTKIVKPIQLALASGWREDETFAEGLERNRKLDRERGYTSCGPHRADLKILHEGRAIKSSFSRGESKITAAVLLLTQTKIMAEKTGESPILLVDDLKSELDHDRCNDLLEIIHEMAVQTFVTNLEMDSLKTNLTSDAYQLFHVEHGDIRLA
jgi:DNA replication and repair protein RecF